MLKINSGFIKFISVCVLLMMTHSRVMAQPITLELSTQKILIGDQIDVAIRYGNSGKELPSVHWTQIPDKIKGLEWVEIGKLDTVFTKDSVLLKQNLIITGFDSGAYYFPTLKFGIVDENNQSLTFQTDSLLIEVATIEVDTAQDFRPIKGVKDMPIGIGDYWKHILIALLIILLIAGAVYYLIQKRKKQKPEEKITPEKAHERALRLLSELKHQQLWQNGDVKGYYNQLSFIVRDYIENRFTIPAMESTSDELLKLTKKIKEVKPFRKSLRTLLNIADLAKFARAHPTQEEHEACLFSAEELIVKTKMKEEEVKQ